jgi:hypothetical protein
MLLQLICYIVKYIKIYLKVHLFFLVDIFLNRWFASQSIFSQKEDECLLGRGFEPFRVFLLWEDRSRGEPAVEKNVNKKI